MKDGTHLKNPQIQGDQSVGREAYSSYDERHTDAGNAGVADFGRGFLVVSLDFELYWGMFDKVSIAEYGENIRGVRTAIPRMLKLFSTYGVSATWAGIGMLMARNRDELIALLPPEERQPQYEDMNVSAYEHIKKASIGVDETASAESKTSIRADVVARVGHCSIAAATGKIGSENGVLDRERAAAACDISAK